MSDKLNLIDTIATQDKFSTFTRLMASSGANGVFDSGGDFTVFVPTNDAFAKIPEHKINELLNEKEQTKLKSLLSYHILSGRVMAANLPGTPTRRAFNGDELTFTDANGLKVNGASVQARNMVATNGVVHAVDAVLTPFSTPTTKSATATAAAATARPAGLAAVPNTNGASVTASPTTPVAETSVTGSKIPVRGDANTKPLI